LELGKAASGRLLFSLYQTVIVIAIATRQPDGLEVVLARIILILVYRPSAHEYVRLSWVRSPELFQSK